MPKIWWRPAHLEGPWTDLEGPWTATRCPWALEGPCPTRMGPWVGLECTEMGPWMQTTCPWAALECPAMTLGWDDRHHPEIVMRFTDLTKKISVVNSSYVTYEQTTLANICFRQITMSSWVYIAIWRFFPFYLWITNTLCRLGMHLFFRSRFSKISLNLYFAFLAFLFSHFLTWDGNLVIMIKKYTSLKLHSGTWGYEGSKSKSLKSYYLMMFQLKFVILDQ